MASTLAMVRSRKCMLEDRFRAVPAWANRSVAASTSTEVA